MRGEAIDQFAVPSARYEWLIRYSHNNLNLDRERLLVFEAGAGSRR
jgi:hypothetical protein